MSVGYVAEIGPKKLMNLRNAATNCKHFCFLRCGMYEPIAVILSSACLSDSLSHKTAGLRYNTSDTLETTLCYLLVPDYIVALVVLLRYGDLDI